MFTTKLAWKWFSCSLWLNNTTQSFHSSANKNVLVIKDLIFRWLCRLIDSVVNCVVKLNLPLSIVDEEPFIKLLADCNNRFKIPCRQTLTKKLIPAKALKAKEQLRADLNLIKYCSLTCDGWTSEGSDSYLGCNRFKFISLWFYYN